MIEITKKLIAYNFTKGGNSKKYIVIHDTGNYKVKANAINHYKYFNGAHRGSSAHYFIDDKTILQVVKDNDIAWHSGVKYGYKVPRNEVNNRNSIGVEMCVNLDGDYETAFKNTIELTKSLMAKYNIPIENVVRHYDATLKTCPKSMSKNDWGKWKEFKEMLITKEDVVKVEEKVFIYNDEEVTLNRILFKDENYIKIKDLEKLGHEVIWDNDKKIVVITDKEEVEEIEYEEE